MKARLFVRFTRALGFLGVISALVAVSLSAESKKEEKSNEDAPLVAEMTISPANLAPESTIKLVFPTPMVKPEAVGKFAEVSPLKIEPPLEGVFEWTSSRSGIYKLKQVPRFNQEYDFRLSDGLVDLTGKKLDTDLLDRVNTAGFAILDQDPKWFGTNDIPRRRALLFQFNDQVNALDANTHMVFRSTDPVQSVPARVRHAEKKDLSMTYSSLQATWTEAISGVEPKLGEGDKRLSALFVEPVDPLPVAASWELIVSKSLSNSSGQASLGRDQVVKLGSVLPLAVESITGHTPFDRPYHIDIAFNKRLKTEDAGKTPEETKAAHAAVLAGLAEHVVMMPELEGTRLELMDDTVRLHGPFVLGTEYRITVTPGIEAWDDLPLEEAVMDQVVSFKPNPPYVSAPAFARSQLARGTGIFEVTAANVTHVRVRAKRLNGPQLLEARELYRGYDNAFERKLEKRRAFKPESIEKYPGDWMLDREFQFNKPLDQSEVIQLNWRELLSDTGGAGAVFLEFEGFAMEGLEDKRIITQTLVESTDLGLMMKASGKDQLLFVTHLETGAPAAGARVTLLDRDRKLLGHGETDANGIARIASNEAVFALAELGQDCAVLDTLGSGSELWNVYGYEIDRSWRNVWQPSRKTFIFSDRDLYRPGDTMYLKAMTRLQAGDSLTLEGQERKARLKFRDARYRLIRDEEITFAANGSYATELKLPEGPLGSYSLNIEFSHGDDSPGEQDEESGGYHYFRVDDYRPNTFEVEIQTANASIEKDRIQVPLTARYYMGKPLSQAEIEWSASSVPGFEPPDEFSDYHFGAAPGWAGYGDGQPSYSEDDGSDWFVSGDLMLSDDGTAVLPLPMPPPHRSAFPQLIEISTDLTDLNQQTLSSHATLRVPGAKVLPGIRESEGFGRAGEAVRLELAVLDGDGKPTSAAVTAEVVVERQDYQTVKVETAGGAISTETTVVLKEEKRESVSISGKPSAYTFTPTRGGSYFVTVTTQDADGVKAFSRLAMYVIGKGEYPWRIENGVRLTLQPESKEVKPGGEAVIAIQCPIEGTALITVERNRLHQHFVKPYTLDDPIIRVPIGETDSPNVFVSVVVVRGAAASGKNFSLPEYRVGYTEILVPSNSLDLQVVVTPDQPEVLPGSELPISVVVKDSRGVPLPGADVTLFAVDEGVLSLTGFETPNPDGFFHRLFQLTFSNYTSIENLLGEAPEDRVRSNKGFLVGGGGEEGDAPQQTRKNFVATPLWVASALTDAEGRSLSTVKVPDNLTRYRLMAVVSAGAERFGQGSSAFTVNKPLMVEPVVPRFARLGDEVLIKGILHNTTQEKREVELSLQLDAGASFIVEARPFGTAVEVGAEPLKLLRKVTVPAGASVAMVFPVRFEGLGETVWQWTAKSVGAGSSLMDATESRFEVSHPVPELREVRYARVTNPSKPPPAPSAPPVNKGQSKTKSKEKTKPKLAVKAEPQGPLNLLAKVNPEILEAEGAIKVNFTTTRLTEVRDGLDYLLKYPYGCVEQTTSATMPWLALGGFHKLFPQQLDPERSREAIQKGVNRILQMVVEGEGGLAYWPGGSEPNLWGSAYGGLMLLRARDAGAQMPAEVVDGLMEYLAKKLRGLDTETDPYIITDAALSLYTLAKAKRAEPAYHTLLFERRGRLPEAAKLYLSLAMLISDGPEDQVKILLGVGNPGESKEPASLSGSRHWAGDGPNRALRLLAYTHMGLAQSADTIANELWNARNLNGEWGNTYSNAWTLTALAAYERSRQVGSHPISAVIAWADIQETVQLSAEKPLAEIELPLDAKRANAPLTVQVPKDESAWVRTEVRGHPRGREFAGENHGYGITRDYRKVLPDGSTAPADDLRVGDLVRISLGIDIGGGDRYLAIEDSLPSVFEAMNPAFETQSERQDGPFDDYELWFCDHRELHANRALFFTDHAPAKGKFVLHYLARVIAEGDTVAPPAKIEAMYEPSKHGLSPIQRVITLPGGNRKVAEK
ncbi:MAG: alpha-2-macroglobulin family protein [Verrucomicrobiaceae bacterium]|nr:alpha-2-macroglobulin family protein [Verrucomicrobiaceae bacterium]